MLTSEEIQSLLLRVPKEERKQAVKLLLTLGYDCYTNITKQHQIDTDALIELYNSVLTKYIEKQGMNVNVAKLKKAAIPPSTKPLPPPYQKRANADAKQSRSTVVPPKPVLSSKQGDILKDLDGPKSKPIVIQFPRSRHGQPNSMYKFPFLDTKSSMRDVLTHSDKELEFSDLETHHQKRLATQLYADMCIGSAKMKLTDVIPALHTLGLSYPPELADSIRRHSYDPTSAHAPGDLDRIIAAIELSHWLDIVHRCIVFTRGHVNRTSNGDRSFSFLNQSGYQRVDAQNQSIKASKTESRLASPASVTRGKNRFQYQESSQNPPFLFQRAHAVDDRDSVDASLLSINTVDRSPLRADKSINHHTKATVNDNNAFTRQQRSARVSESLKPLSEFLEVASPTPPPQPQSTESFHGRQRAHSLGKPHRPTPSKGKPGFDRNQVTSHEEQQIGATAFTISPGQLRAPSRPRGRQSDPVPSTVYDHANGSSGMSRQRARSVPSTVHGRLHQSVAYPNPAAELSALLQDSRNDDDLRAYVNGYSPARARSTDLSSRRVAAQLAQDYVASKPQDFSRIRNAKSVIADAVRRDKMNFLRRQSGEDSVAGLSTHSDIPGELARTHSTQVHEDINAEIDSYFLQVSAPKRNGTTTGDNGTLRKGGLTWDTIMASSGEQSAASASASGVQHNNTALSQRRSGGVGTGSVTIPSRRRSDSTAGLSQHLRPSSAGPSEGDAEGISSKSRRSPRSSLLERNEKFFQTAPETAAVTEDTGANLRASIDSTASAGPSMKVLVKPSAPSLSQESGSYRNRSARRVTLPADWKQSNRGWVADFKQQLTTDVAPIYEPIGGGPSTSVKEHKFLSRTSLSRRGVLNTTHSSRNEDGIESYHSQEEEEDEEEEEYNVNDDANNYRDNEEEENDQEYEEDTGEEGDEYQDTQSYEPLYPDASAGVTDTPVKQHSQDLTQHELTPLQFSPNPASGSVDKAAMWTNADLTPVHVNLNSTSSAPDADAIDRVIDEELRAMIRTVEEWDEFKQRGAGRTSAPVTKSFTDTLDQDDDDDDDDDDEDSDEIGGEEGDEEEEGGQQNDEESDTEFDEELEKIESLLKASPKRYFSPSR